MLHVTHACNMHTCLIGMTHESCMSFALHAHARMHSWLLDIVCHIIHACRSPSHVCMLMHHTCMTYLFMFAFLVYRSGLGVVGAEAHAHGATIMRQGFSLKKCEDVVVFTCKADDTASHDFNRQLVALSQGQIPPLAELRFVSVGGAHTNSFLRALNAGCITHQKALQDVNGKLNAEKLSAGKPQLASALQEGMNWLIIDPR